MLQIRTDHMNTKNDNLRKLMKLWFHSKKRGEDLT